MRGARLSCWSRHQAIGHKPITENVGGMKKKEGNNARVQDSTLKHKHFLHHSALPTDNLAMPLTDRRTLQHFPHFCKRSKASHWKDAYDFPAQRTCGLPAVLTLSLQWFPAVCFYKWECSKHASTRVFCEDSLTFTGRVPELEFKSTVDEHC